MSKFIQSIKVPGCATIMELVIPKKTVVGNIGAVNLLCGENCSGKSYILQQLEAAYRTNDMGKGGFEIRYEKTDDSFEEDFALFYGKIWKHKDRCASFHFTGQKNTVAPSDAPTQLYRSTLRFFYEIIFSENKFGISMDSFSDVSSRELRLKLINDMGIEANGDLCIPCNNEHPLVKQIENIVVGKQLYYRFFHEKKEEICVELAFINPDGYITTQSKWSDGQKSLFYLLLNLYYQNSSIVILDEVENHLHPSYITQILKIIKSSGKQCIVSTHHPHVIFSEYVDRVFYMELSKESFGTTIRKEQKFTPSTRAFKRFITTLETDFEKISNVYKLFDDRDTQLLRMASFFKSEIEVIVYKALETLPIANTPVAFGHSFQPDKQTGMLYDMLHSRFTSCDRLNILDVGAGLGRVKDELEKNLTINNSIKWYLFNPDQIQTASTREHFRGCSNVFSIMDYSEIPTDTYFDIVIVANVIHEITPPMFSQILVESANRLGNDGVLIILEMEPLLHPEQYAVPYNYGELINTLNDIGWKNEHYLLPHRFVVLYAIAAQKGSHTMIDMPQVTNILNKLWIQKKTNAIRQYGFGHDTLSYQNYMNLLQVLTTIASIDSYFDGDWK